MAKCRYFPSGRHVLSIDNYPRGENAVWADGKGRLEDQLSEVLRSLLALPELLKEKRRQIQEAEKRRREDQLRQYELRRQAERRQQCLDDLVREAEQYLQHRNLTLYLDEVERRAAQRGGELSDKFHHGIAAARHLADELLHVDERIDQLSAHGLIPEQGSNT